MTAVWMRGHGRCRLGPVTDRKNNRHCRAALRLVLAGVLIAHGVAAAAQSVARPADRLVLRQLASSGVAEDGDRGAVRNAQFMPGMPQMPPMMTPRPGGTQGSMGGGMTMVMTGDTMLEMGAGACTAGLFIGGVAAAAAATPAAPVSAAMIVNSAAIGCGFAIAATAAGMAGMMGWRAVAGFFE
jgi:hypothetical protein